MNLILSKTEASKTELMKRLDFKGLKFYLFLPSFNILFRKKISKRINDYQGQVALALKDTIQYVIVSDNVIRYHIERNNYSQLREYFNLPTGIDQFEVTDPVSLDIDKPSSRINSHKAKLK